MMMLKNLVLLSNKHLSKLNLIDVNDFFRRYYLPEPQVDLLKLFNPETHRLEIKFSSESSKPIFSISLDRYRNSY